MSTQNPLQTTFPIWPCGESQGAAIPNPEKGIVAKWNNYFGKNVNDLAKWKQLCSDLDKSADTFTTKTQCQKAHTPDYAWALKDVWVHIHDFHAAENKPDDVVFFTSECDLTTYTQKSPPSKLFPRHNILRRSPLCDLLAHMLYARGGKYRWQTYDGCCEATADCG